MSILIFNFNEMFCFNLYSASNAVIRFYAKPLKDIGITYPQLLVLIALWKQGVLSTSVISEKTNYDLGSLTPIIKRLENGGFVKTTIDPIDRRRRKVKVTQKGLQLQEPVARIFDDFKCTLDLTEEELACSLKVLRKINLSLPKQS